MNKAFTQENDLRVVNCFTFWQKKVVPITGISYKWCACKAVFYYWTFWGCTWDWVSVVINYCTMGLLLRLWGDWVKIHPQNSPKVQYLLQQWPGLKHNLHYHQYMLQKVMLQPVGSTNTCLKHTAIMRLFSFRSFHTSHTYRIRCHVLSCPNMQETNSEGSIQYHTTCHAMTCYSKCFNAQVMHLSLKATMPQFPCIFCSLSSPPRFHKSVTMLSPV